MKRIKIKLSRKKHKDSKIVAKLVVITAENKVLLLKRSNYLEKHKKEWDLPGGHIHEGEDLLKGLAREVKEETKIKTKNPKFVFQEKNNYFYFDRLDPKKITLSKEHTAHIFLTIEEIKDLKSITNYYKEVVLKCFQAFETEYD